MYACNVRLRQPLIYYSYHSVAYTHLLVVYHIWLHVSSALYSQLHKPPPRVIISSSVYDMCVRLPKQAPLTLNTVLADIVLDVRTCSYRTRDDCKVSFGYEDLADGYHVYVKRETGQLTFQHYPYLLLCCCNEKLYQ